MQQYNALQAHGQQCNALQDRVQQGHAIHGNVKLCNHSVVSVVHGSFESIFFGYLAHLKAEYCFEADQGGQAGVYFTQMSVSKVTKQLGILCLFRNTENAPSIN